MKKIKNYEDFINEEINWRKSLAGAAIAASLNLTSCDTPKEVENKIPQIEILVKNRIDELNDYGEEGDTVILNNTEVRGPFNLDKLLDERGKMIEDPNNTYYIVSDITTITTNSKKNEYYIMVYLEDKQTGDGKIVATQFVNDKKELELNINFYKKYLKFPRNTTEFLNLVETQESLLNDMKKSFKTNPYRDLPLRDYYDVTSHKTLRFRYDGKNLHLFSLDDTGETMAEKRLDIALSELEYHKKTGIISKEQYDELYDRATKLKSELANF